MKHSSFKQFGCVSWAAFIGGILLVLLGALFLIDSLLIPGSTDMTAPIIFMFVAGGAAITLSFVMKNLRVR